MSILNFFSKNGFNTFKDYYYDYSTIKLEIKVKFLLYSLLNLKSPPHLLALFFQRPEIFITINLVFKIFITFNIFFLYF